MIIQAKIALTSIPEEDENSPRFNTVAFLRFKKNKTQYTNIITVLLHLLKLYLGILSYLLIPKL